MTFEILSFLTSEQNILSNYTLALYFSLERKNQ